MGATTTEADSSHVPMLSKPSGQSSRGPQPQPRELLRHKRAGHTRQSRIPRHGGPMNADILTTTVADGIAVITLGNAKRIFFDAEMGDDLTEALDRFAGDPAFALLS
jgi:hypothetical protein